MSESKTSSGGIGLGGVVFLIFLVLKLTGHIDWSWWWVTAPIWGVLAVGLALILVGLVWMCIAGVIPDVSARRRR